MIQTRVLELLKNPKNIQSEDLPLLKEEINSFPYLQNIRALHLYGVHLYDKENYQKTLSSTAAYTTDKKILYQLINGKTQTLVKQEVVSINQEIAPENSVETPIVEKENLQEEIVVRNEANNASNHDYEAASEGLLAKKPEVKHLVVDGERNRILFEGEENFLNETNNATIDLESTLESGVIVTHKSVSNQNNLNETDKNEVEEIAKTVINETTIVPEPQIEEIKIDSELNLKETISESDLIENKEVTEVLNPELIIEEEKIETDQLADKINDDAELSFHGTDAFLPKVKIESNKTTEITTEAPKPNINKHEDEMRRLIEEVEKKMKAKKEIAPEKTEVIEEETNNDISFAETQPFHIVEEPKATIEVIETTAETVKEEIIEIKNSEKKPEVVEEILEEKPATEVISTWKPMSFETSRPDSFVTKYVEISQPKEEILKVEETSKPEPVADEIPKENLVENISENSVPSEVSEDLEETEKEKTSNEQNGEAPVMNVSFFGSDIASLGLSYQADQKEKADAKELQEKIAQQNIEDSNVPGFINTWQSWLKIDRAEETPVDKIEIKNKVIESFIENNPKISQLKDELNFVVKEKTDDISHLMTETLANLYIEQKLYSKAINAFLILANKHPDRKEYFLEKIQEIKDSRGKN